MVKRLVHIGLTVFDLERMVNFYTSILGLTVKVNTSNELAVHFWDPEGNRIHLTQRH